MRTDCADPASEIGCVDNFFGNFSNVEILSVPVTGGAPLTIFVDTSTSNPASHGPYTLTLSL